MMDIKVGGENVFTLIAIGPCESCVLAGKAGECPHYEKPPWKSGRKYQEVAAVLAASGDAGLTAREMDGIITSSKHFLVLQRWINDFKARPPHVFTEPVPVVLIGIDPHGGGDGSSTGVFDLILTRNESRMIDVVNPLSFFFLSFCFFLFFTIANTTTASCTQNRWPGGTTCHCSVSRWCRPSHSHKSNTQRHARAGRQTASVSAWLHLSGIAQPDASCTYC